MSNRLTIPEVAHRLRSSPRSVLALIQAGRLRAINVGTGAKRPRWIVDQDDLERFENGRANAPSPVERQQRRRSELPNYYAGRN
jgi:excisionase family DNA binding protein